jgi:hypothetical protein
MPDPLSLALASAFSGMHIVMLSFLVLVGLLAGVSLLPGPLGKRAYKTLRAILRLKIPPGG